MAKMIPTAEKLRTYMHRAGATQKELEAQITTLEKEVDSRKVSLLEQLELRQQLQNLERTVLDMQRTMDAIPADIRAAYEITENDRKETLSHE